MRTSASPSPYGNTPIPPPAYHTPFTAVVLSNFYAFSFNALIKLLQHFKRARTIRIEKVKWESPAAQDVVSLHRRALGRNSLAARPLCITITGCTDCSSLCLQTCLLYSDFPLCVVPAAERAAVAQLLMIFRDSISSTMMSWDGTEDTVRFKITKNSKLTYILSFICPQEATTVNDHGHRRIKAICVQVSSGTWGAINYPEFGRVLCLFPALLNVVVSLDSSGDMRNDFFERQNIRRPTVPAHIAFNVACPSQKPPSLPGDVALPNSKLRHRRYQKHRLRGPTPGRSTTDDAWQLFNPVTLKPIARFKNHDSIIPWLLKCQGIFNTAASDPCYADGILMDATVSSTILAPSEPFCFFSLEPSESVECEGGSVITFTEHDGRGTRLQDVLHDTEFVIIHIKPGFLSTSTFIKVRTTWPGYAEHTALVPVRVNARDEPYKFTLTPKELLAACVARAVQSFYNNASAIRLPDATHWSLKTTEVPFEHLWLVRIHCVSADSWQPVLVYHDPPKGDWEMDTAQIKL
ncbi:hypothetical protein BC835DRAFT_1357773 [Cytidiella melzeri]|nr:hypothetical protein BC835DRAFT_1357773 [Cytidiella melzeri]